MANTGTVGIAGLYTPTTGARTITGSTVNFNGTSAQSVPASTYNNLTYSGSNTGTFAGDITVNGNFSQASGTVALNASAGNRLVNIGGSFSLSGGTFSMINSRISTGTTVTVTGNTTISGSAVLNMEATSSTNGVSIFQTQILRQLQLQL